MEYIICDKWVLVYHEDTLFIETTFYIDSGCCNLGTAYKVVTFETEAEMNQYIVTNNLQYYTF